MTTWINSQFPRPDFHRQVQRHYGLQDTGFPRGSMHAIIRPEEKNLFIHLGRLLTDRYPPGRISPILIP